MKIWFIGGGSFAAGCLRNVTKFFSEANANGANLILERVITGLPTRSGRGMRENISRVEAAALELGLPSEMIERTGRLSDNESLIATLNMNPPDVIFVIDFAQLIREPYLSAPRFGCLNIHPSLLPRWRGAAPIPRAVLSGDAETGVTVFRLVTAMDAGPILRQASERITPTTTASQLYDRLSELGAEIAVKGLCDLARVTTSPASAGDAERSLFTDQDDSLATHAEKLTREEFEIHWDWSVEKIDRSVRGLDAAGGAFVLWTLNNSARPQRLKLWRVTPVHDLASNNTEPGAIISVTPSGPIIACGVGALRLDEVQAEGKRRTSGADWARGQASLALRK